MPCGICYTDDPEPCELGQLKSNKTGSCRGCFFGVSLVDLYDKDELACLTSPDGNPISTLWLFNP